MGKVLTVVVFVIAIAAPAPANAANLLSNSGFETGDFSDWNQWNSGSAMINSWGHSGSYSVGAWWASSGWQDVAISDPSTALKVGGWLYDDVAGSESMKDGVYASIRVEFKKADDSIVGTWTTGQLTGDSLTDNAWNEKTALVTPSSYGTGIDHATLVWEVNNNGSGSGRGIFDDFTVDTQAVPEPASLLLLGSGLVGLLGLRKRTGK